MATRRIVDPVYELTCDNCGVRHMPARPYDASGDNNIRSDAAKHDWLPRPHSGKGSRTDTDLCPRCRPTTPRQEQATVDEFNAAHPVGSPVSYRKPGFGWRYGVVGHPAQLDYRRLAHVGIDCEYESGNTYSDGWYFLDDVRPRATVPA